MRTAALIAVAACAYPRTGGAPGPSIVTCRDGDEACTLVTATLEARRANIGSRCENPNVYASALLALTGRPALPYLERAFDDRDPEVALLAMRTAVAIGDRPAVDAWCRGISDRFRIEMCRSAQETEETRGRPEAARRYLDLEPCIRY